MVWLRLRKTQCTKQKKQKQKPHPTKWVIDAHTLSAKKGRHEWEIKIKNSIHENENSTTTAQIKAVNRNETSDLID